MIKSLSVKNQSIETSVITKDYKEAICEFVWNGFEANANEIRISYTLNQLESIDTIIISDDGDGIDYNDLNETFGAFLASKKNMLSLNIKSKPNKGKGRFSFKVFSSMVKWDTVYKENEELKQYSITLRNENKEEYEFDEPHVVEGSKHTGTRVNFYNVSDITPKNLSNTALEDYLLCQFAWYLYLNKSKKLYLNDIKIDYNRFINSDLSEIIYKKIDSYNFKICLIIWKEKIKEKFRAYFLNSNQSLKGIDTTTFNRNTVDFNHSIFVESSFFDKWDEFIPIDDLSGQITLSQTLQDTFRLLKKEIQSLIETKIHQYMSCKANEEVEKMINQRKTFPIFPDDLYGSMRRNDLVNFTKHLYCLEPRIFYKLKDVQEKSFLAFLNLLLSSEERENILTVIEQIVQLTYEQRNKLADILKKTHLENIIETISFIERRYQIIEILKTIIFDFTNYANERDHIQKIIEQNYWLFGEEYNLASADQTMQKALEQYNYILYGAKTATDKLSDELEVARRMDIFMCGSKKVNVSLNNFLEENIVVELKAPKVTLTKDVFRQIEDYMDIILRNPQFNSQLRRWKFIAVCKEVDDYIQERYGALEDKARPGLVHAFKNCEIYALTWDDVFKSFELRHSFILDKLKYNRDQLLKGAIDAQAKKGRDTVNNLTNIAVGHE